MSAMRRVGPGVLLLALGVLGCAGEGGGHVRVTKQRTWHPVGRGESWGLSAHERFGFERRDDRSAGGITWSTPGGWVELPSTSMRAANFLVAGDERSECYLTVLDGDGGGLLANVNRWRGQMSLPPIDADELARLPRSPLFASPALRVDFEGTWTGMGGGQEREGHRLVGLLAVDGGRARFLKMTGPAEVLEHELDAFLALAASFREGRSPVDPHADPHAGLGGLPSSVLSWTAPEGWRRAPDRPMREVTFSLGEEDGAECYVTLLGGNGGGAFANVNRWRNQMGRVDLAADEFAGLQRIEMLGGEGVIVEVEGTYRGMGTELVERAVLLGAVCELADQAVFVKLVGREAVVRAAREDFLAFCRSLERGG